MQIESLKIFCDVARLSKFSRGACGRQITSRSRRSARPCICSRSIFPRAQFIDRSRRPAAVDSAGGACFFEGCQRPRGRNTSSWKRRCAAPQEHLETTVAGGSHSTRWALGDMSLYVEQFKRIPASRPDFTLSISHPDRVCEKVLDGTGGFRVWCVVPSQEEKR